MKKIMRPEHLRTTFEEILEQDGVLVYTNVGTSMMPLLRQRKDLIEIRRQDGRCRKYDVILYKRRGKYILHRILKVFPDGYLIAGDHCTFVERDVTDEMILGVMTKVIRNRKTITPNNIWYKMYVHLWCDFYPIRMIIIRGKYYIKVIMNAIKRRLWERV